jgi:hypothetical protein
MKTILNALGDTFRKRRPGYIRIPGLHENLRLGLGDLVKRLTLQLGIQPCERCNRRAEVLNRSIVFYGGMAGIPQKVGGDLSPASQVLESSVSRSGHMAMSASDPCWHFRGYCTGFGRQQCITAPASQEPDALIITQCCGGWFQYPWILVCPGQPARQGCGFCFW